MKSPLIAALAAAVLATAANAQTRLQPSAAATPVAVIVKVAKPWYAPKSVVLGKMRDTIPQYENLAGLNYKMFSLAQSDGHFGDIYLWESQASADQWFSAAWHERVRKTYGTEAALEWFDTPSLLPSKLADNRIEMARP